MAYDIQWLKEEGHFMTKDGEVKTRPIRRPTYFLEILQKWVHKSNSLATSKGEELASKTEGDFLNLSELKEGEALFDIGGAIGAGGSALKYCTVKPLIPL